MFPFRFSDEREIDLSLESIYTHDEHAHFIANTETFTRSSAAKPPMHWVE